jgi:hypothetical protein
MVRLDHLFSVRCILAQNIKVSTAGENQVRSWQAERSEELICDMFGEQFQEKRAPSQTFECPSRGDRIDKALHTGKVAPDEAEVRFHLIQPCLIQVGDDCLREGDRIYLLEIAVQRQGKGRSGFRMVIQRDIRERGLIMPTALSLRWNGAPMLFQ